MSDENIHLELDVVLGRIMPHDGATGFLSMLPDQLGYRRLRRANGPTMILPGAEL